MTRGGAVVLAELSAVLATFPETDGEEACEGWFDWRGGDERPDGSDTMPWCQYGPRMDALWAALKRAGALDDADYMRWPALEDYHAGRKHIAEAPRSDLGKWLFAVYRQERFVEGLWAEQLRHGRLKDAVARLIALETEGE